jgi:uncharacterized protein
VDRLREYSIPFLGLSLGSHQFEFEIDDSFFENFEYSQIHSARIHADVTMERQERMLIFRFSFTGFIHTNCDRCTEEFDLKVDDTQQLVVKFGHEFKEESEDVIVIPDMDHKFNIAQYIHEYLQLMLPIRIVHPDDENGKSTCNPDMLKRIEELSRHQNIDPRWEVLQKIQRKGGN